MARVRQVTTESLSLRLQASGVVSARALAEALRVDRSAISRGLTALGRRVVRLGAARSARYALRREVRGAGDRWPLFRVDETGRTHACGRLHAVHGGFWWETETKGPAWLRHGSGDGVFPGLPFFLSDVRPQGFLGRALARRHGATLGLPTDPRDWGDDDIVAFLNAEGDELPGDIMFGEAALARVLRVHDAGAAGLAAVGEAERAGRYAEFAEAAVRGDAVGSSAAGEQPKFTAVVRAATGELRSVLVKFSPPRETPSGRRWADLLTAEAHALRVLAENGETAASAETLTGGGRVFLETTRFDRVGAFGRRGVLSLAAIEAGLLDRSVGDWAAAARAMEDDGLFDDAEADRLRRRWCFGQLIANTDMHLGNAAVWFGDAEPFRLAPVYDMLPMLWAPGVHGELVPREFAPPPPRPDLRAQWHTAVPWAREFWRRVESDGTVSTDFRRLAGEAGRTVDETVRRWE